MKPTCHHTTRIHTAAHLYIPTAAADDDDDVLMSRDRAMTAAECLGGCSEGGGGGGDDDGDGDDDDDDDDDDNNNNNNESQSHASPIHPTQLSPSNHSKTLNALRSPLLLSCYAHNGCREC